MEDDLAWTSHPSGEIDQQVQHVQPSVPERKNRIGRLLRSEPVSAGAFTKLRSVSLSRTEDSAIKEAPIYPAPSSADPSSSSHPASTKPSAGSSSVKLARSKSSVEKKIQHEVAVFWRRTKEGKLFQKKETPDKEGPANADQVQPSCHISPPAVSIFPSFNEIIGSRRVDQKGSSRSSCWKCPKPNVKICARSNETRRKSGRGATPVPTKRNRHRRSCPGYSDRGGVADDFERRRRHQQLRRRLRQRAGRHRRLSRRNPFPFRDPLSATKKRMTKKRWRSIGGSLISQRTPTLLRRVDRLFRRRAAWSRNGQKRISMQCERRWLRPRPAGWKNV